MGEAFWVVAQLDWSSDNRWFDLWKAHASVDISCGYFLRKKWAIFLQQYQITTWLLSGDTTCATRGSFMGNMQWLPKNISLIKQLTSLNKKNNAPVLTYW